MKVQIPSQSKPDVCHDISVDPDLGRIQCDCRHWELFQHCSHVRSAAEIVAEMAAARALLKPVCHRLRAIGMAALAETLSETEPTLEAARAMWDDLDTIETAINSLRGLGQAWKK